MKKIIFLIIALFTCFNVYAARDYNFKEYTYRVVIDGETYTATVKYFEDPTQPDSSDSKYTMDEDTIVLTNSNMENFSYNGDPPYRIISIGGGFCANSKLYACNENRSSFSKDEIENPDFMLNYLPKFIKYNNAYAVDKKTAFLYYIGDETNISDEQKKEFIDSLKKYYAPSNYGKEPDVQVQTKQQYNSSNDMSYDDIGIFDDLDIKDMPTNSYVKYADALRRLLEEAEDVKVCTEEDLNKIRIARDASLFDLDKIFENVTLSSSCYNVLYGEGFGDGNLFINVVKGSSYMGKTGTVIADGSRSYSMAYLYYETFYQKGVAFLTGETMQQEPKEVVHCGIFDEKTTAIFQYAFNVMKYAGIILGTLLGVVDVFKIIVSKDVDGKKQFKVLSKRIIAIVLLILTPVFIEIIFKFINTIGVDDPICGIR